MYAYRYSVYILHLPVSKYILLYNHYDNSEHSSRSASVVHQVIGHAKCDRVCQIVPLAPLVLALVRHARERKRSVLQLARLAVTVET